METIYFEMNGEKCTVEHNETNAMCTICIPNAGNELEFKSYHMHKSSVDKSIWEQFIKSFDENNSMCSAYIENNGRLALTNNRG